MKSSQFYSLIGTIYFAVGVGSKVAFLFILGVVFLIIGALLEWANKH